MVKKIYWVRLCFEVRKEDFNKEDVNTLIENMIGESNELKNIGIDVEERIGV